jgi:membrane protease YdiL (CAAX protease family)
MTNFPEDESPELVPANVPEDDSASLAPAPTSSLADEQPVESTRAGAGAGTEPEPADFTPDEPIQLAPVPGFVSYAPPGPSPSSDDLLFQSFTQPPVRPPTRIPHLGHLGLLIPIGGVAFACTIAVLFIPMRFHLFGWSFSPQAAATNVQLILATEAILYLFTFALSFFIFPFFWHEKFFAGLQWRGAVALHRFWPLAATALGCAGLAALDEVLMPGPSNAPIEKMMRAPGAAWLMFAFGTTVAPFFEEMFFRGFLLPALCTAWDWAAEQFSQHPAPPLDANGHPQWSISAMIAGSIVTSIPFALLHVDQQGHSLGPFLLLILVSLVLCAVRLKTRSLAASTLVHAAYNFIIFALALIGTSGFRHFDKM